MAAPTILAMMNGDRTLHPFFAKPDLSRAEKEPPPTEDARVPGLDDQSDGASDGVARQRGGRSIKSKVSALGKTQKTLLQVINPGPPTPSNTSEHGDEADADSENPTFDVSPPRKRRRKGLAGTHDLPDENTTPNGKDEATDNASPRQLSPPVVIPVSSPLSTQPSHGNSTATTPPKKMLRLNASGKFSSPVSKKPEKDTSAAEEARRRARPRKPKTQQDERHALVVMKYVVDTEGVGRRIDRILSGEERHEIKEIIRTSNKKCTPRKAHLPKITHPFFQAKSRDPAPKQQSPRKASAVTPGKLRRQTMEARSPLARTGNPGQDYNVGSGLFKDRLMFKHPGAKEPAWPSKEQMHVRGLDEDEIDGARFRALVRRASRKGKAISIQFPAEQSVLRRFSSGLRPERDGALRPDGFREPHPSLRLPQKLLIPGQLLAHRVRPELSLPIGASCANDLSQFTPSQEGVHPALRRMHDRLLTSCSAFDENRAEVSSWTQKYMPTASEQVLQPAREINVLRDWLTSLTVTTVSSTSKLSNPASRKAEIKPRKKRRRKAADLDEFLVSDDEEVHDMDELTDPGEPSMITDASRKGLKSIIHVAADGARLSNAVLLSGPSGCGKTATAHAVASELGFKIFEINAGERRSGKDVLDKIGDMTENHLVKHHGTDTAETSAAEEPNHMDEALQRDLVSGRQGTMNSFFKPKTTAKAAPKAKNSPPKKQILQAVTKAIKKAAKDQQQSLILLEEVDLLFKDDKDFWGTVFKLIASSKRPFIMTCNDEDLVPLQAMSLHAILRLSLPPVDLAVDYLLLLTANEGHLLKRDAVTSLYDSKRHDLRASIAELDFWCQMGVGDPRGGLSWIYQRYPLGCDLDAEGCKLRVVSEDTYQSHMGQHLDSSLDDETHLLNARSEYGIDVADALGWRDETSMAAQSLKAFSSAADSLSAADVYAGRLDALTPDATQSPMAEKARAHYIEGTKLLQTDECADYSHLTAQLAVASTLAALHGLHSTNHATTATKIQHAIQTQPQRSTSLTRSAFACFDALCIPTDTTAHPHSSLGLSQSTFDGPLAPIVTDVAPYVRSIIHYDLLLAEQRERLASIMNEGHGNSGSSSTAATKRARTTRAARSALEGGQRASTRREKWFAKDLDVLAVLATAGKTWPRSLFAARLDQGVASVDGSGMGSAAERTPASSAEVMGGETMRFVE